MRSRVFNLIVLLVAVGIVLFAFNDYFIYEKFGKEIAEIKEVKTRKIDEKPTPDGNTEEYYHQDIRAVFKNGSAKGKEVLLENTYASSLVYDDKFKSGNEVFVEKVTEISATSSDVQLTGSIAGQKRDQHLAIIFSLAFAMVLLLGRKQGVFTLLSLFINIILFYGVLKLYISGVNLLLLTVPLILCVSTVLLLMVLGVNKKSLIALIAVFCTVAAVSLISAAVLNFSKVDYDFMEYLRQPYDTYDAYTIFLSEILIAGLGAVMDMAVMTVSITYELVLKNPRIGLRSLLESCKNVSDDVLGTMLSVMLFANLAAGMPYFVLALKNGIHFSTIIRYNLFFEIARFLTGSIGIVIAVPAAIFISAKILTRARMPVGEEE